MIKLERTVDPERWNRWTVYPGPEVKKCRPCSLKHTHNRSFSASVANLLVAALCIDCFTIETVPIRFPPTLQAMPTRNPALPSHDRLGALASAALYMFALSPVSLVVPVRRQRKPDRSRQSICPTLVKPYAVASNFFS